MSKEFNHNELDKLLNLLEDSNPTSELSTEEINQIMSEFKLTDEETEVLFDRILKGDKEAKEKIIGAHQVLISATIEKYLETIADIKKTFDISELGMNYEKLMCAGNIGLDKAIDKFDYSKGYNFSIYSFWWIHEAIHRGIADNFNISVHMLENIYLVSRYANLSKKEIADKLDMPIETVKKIFDTIQDIQCKRQGKK